MKSLHDIATFPPASVLVEDAEAAANLAMSLSPYSSLGFTEVEIRLRRTGHGDIETYRTSEHGVRIDLDEFFIRGLWHLSTSLPEFAINAELRGGFQPSAGNGVINAAFMAASFQAWMTQPIPAWGAEFLKVAPDMMFPLESYGFQNVENRIQWVESSVRHVTENPRDLFRKQLCFLVLHEFAHATLGHLDQSGASHRPEDEINADLSAAVWYQSNIARLRGEDIVRPLSLFPVFSVLSTVAFVEELKDLIRRCVAVRCVIPGAVIPLSPTHPAIKERIKRVLGLLESTDQFGYHTALVLEGAVFSLKIALITGAASQYALRRISRVEATYLAQDASFRKLRRGNRSAVPEVAHKVDIIGFDTGDLKQDPLPVEVVTEDFLLSPLLNYDQEEGE
jgi:hypothetical protein